MRTRRQQQDRAKEGIPPTPPQALSTPRPRRTTRQTSRPASTEPAPVPATTSKSSTKALDKVIHGEVKKKKSKDRTITRPNQGKNKRGSRQTSPIVSDDLPSQSHISPPPAITEEPEASDAAEEQEDVAMVPQDEGIFPFSSELPISSLSSGRPEEMMPDAPPAGSRRESETSQLFRKIVEGNSTGQEPNITVRLPAEEEDSEMPDLGEPEVGGVPEEVQREVSKVLLVSAQNSLLEDGKPTKNGYPHVEAL